MKKIFLLIVLIAQILAAQTIKGTFPQARNMEITLIGYAGFSEKEIVKTTADSLGNFLLIYPEEYKGAALLQIQNVTKIIVLLNHENFEMQLDNLQDFNTLKFTNSFENDAFAKGIIIYQEAEQKLTGLKYLLPLYKNKKICESWLQKEIKTQEQIFENFTETLPKDSYVKSYLKYRKFIGEVQLTKERYKEASRLSQHEDALKKIDFANDALWHSGLLKEILSNYYQAAELYEDKEKITEHNITANEVWLKALEKEPTKQQELAEYYFTLFEKKNLTKVSEHIALSMLNNKSCQLTDKQTNLFEQYRKLGIGKTAPNIRFNQSDLKDLKNLKNVYKLVVFGASWCPNCQTDYPSLLGKYKTLKDKYDLEIIYVSIDTDKAVFGNYYKEAPFIIFCDYKGWETQTAKEYHVFATPTYILLDKELKILAKIQSPEHLETWFNNKK